MPPLDDDHCYSALLARDRRFDGVFFTAVTSTGIYCRPVCPAPTPRRDRCRFFTHAAVAEREGFRPCLRCRPELAPGHSPMESSSRLATAAAARIAAGALSDGSIDDLAAEFGVTARHLRRAVEQEIGVPPIALAQTHRLLLAKRLIAETHLSLADIAFASGFSSVRRFNALFQERYGLTPGALRRPSQARNGAALELAFTLAFRPPLDWPLLVRFLGMRSIPGVEAVEGLTYRRTLRIGKLSGWFSARPADGGHPAIRLELSASLAPVVMQALHIARALFDLDARPALVADHFTPDPILGPLVERSPGLRVPGAVDGFELGMRAILGQQVSVRGATTLAGRIADRYGEPLETPLADLSRLSPTPERIANAGVDAIAAIGLPRKRAETIVSFAIACAEGRVRLRPGMDPAPAIASLEALPGIGPWTAHYIAMRALRWPDAFPHSDLVVMKALGVKRPAAALAAAESWRPWRAYATLHLWNSVAANPAAPIGATP